MNSDSMKQGLYLVVGSLLIIVLMHYFRMGTHMINVAYVGMSNEMSLVFSGGSTGRLIRQAISLVVIPVLIALIPAGIYWLVKRSIMPHLVLTIWGVWLVLVTLRSMY